MDNFCGLEKVCIFLIKFARDQWHQSLHKEHSILFSSTASNSPSPRQTFSQSGQKQITRKLKIDEIVSSPVNSEGDILPINRKGPDRALSLEQEYLLLLMRLRLGLLVKDVAFRFQISSTRVSQIWINWIKLMSIELQNLIIWPSRGQVRATMPKAFVKLYPKLRTIIDCTEIFVETPCSLI